VIAAPPLLVGADHDADQFRFPEVSDEVAVKDVTNPGTVLKTERTTLDSASAEVPPAFVALANALK
jgi:hypothetical protein